MSDQLNRWPRHTYKRTYCTDKTQHYGVGVTHAHTMNSKHETWGLDGRKQVVSGEQFKFRHYNPLILHRTATHMYALGTLTTHAYTVGPL